MTALSGWLAALLDDGIAVRDSFLSAHQVSALKQCAKVRRERGEFSAARIGATRVHRDDIRGDSICWLTRPGLDERKPFDAELGLLDTLEELRLELNLGSLLGLFELELHYAEYAPGAAYARHVDRPRGLDDRIISVVLYLNERWTPDDGGALRIFGAGGRIRDIEPAAGRLVLFLTAGLEHAVLPARRVRSSLTGWYRRRAEEL
jgi:SM-20-related protein